MSRIDQLNVMIVDDNQHMRSLVRAIMEAIGIRNLIEARDGEHALDKMRNNEVHLVITDWNMEPMDGIDFTRYLRSSPDSPDPFIPVIMLTGHTERAKVELARDAGVDEFIAKPVTAKALLARINSIVNHRRPFIRTGRYFGPDRRRKNMPFDGPEKRADEN
ncbi:response regulator [Oceanibaculum indicum]|uniref:Response regulator receiver domain-containing protein n=1 Tax=Oceanibaculum indicum TaxID=526216 RepID=A0A420WAX7_9PROT|nr:response regulator [Oceanibaculum indicum]MCH2559486.1 response regulator [Alcanivorax sp.]RKQ68161.1 response regulator receiver domain-containing protein [Oceanibaculum indicum]